VTPLLTFEHDHLEGQVLYLESQRRLQLWYRIIMSNGQPFGEWDFGHAKTLPEGMRPIDGALAMVEFVKGDLDHAAYNHLLPTQEDS
jgi:hypothetical protein